MAQGQVWNGTVIIPVLNNQTVSNPSNPTTISVNLSQLQINWGPSGPPPALSNSSTLGFTVPSGYIASYSYAYDLHGHTSGAQGGQVPTLVSQITSTDSTESPLSSSIPINYTNTDWWYGPPSDTSHPLANVGMMNNPPSQITYNFTNTSQVTLATWNIYITVGFAASSGGGGGPGGLSWETIAIIIFVIIIVLLILYFLFSGSDSSDSPPPSSAYSPYGYPPQSYPPPSMPDYPPPSMPNYYPENGY